EADVARLVETAVREFGRLDGAFNNPAPPWRSTAVPPPSDRPGRAGAAGRWQAVVQRPGRAPAAVLPRRREGVALPARSARTTWTGGLEDGTGTVGLVSSGVGRYEVSFPRRAAEEAGGVTSPEELIAAAHTACFAMQFAALLGDAGGSGQALDVDAQV